MLLDYKDHENEWVTFIWGYMENEPPRKYRVQKKEFTLMRDGVPICSLKVKSIK